MSGPIERVVVTLDAASENQTAIDTAVRVAARTGMPLHGLFVEDQDLFRLADLPFARQVTIGRGAEPLSAENIALQLRVEAERARHELVGAAKRHQVECTFEIVRGTSELRVAGASERDLVITGGSDPANCRALPGGASVVVIGRIRSGAVPARAQPVDGTRLGGDPAARPRCRLGASVRDGGADRGRDGQHAGGPVRAATGGRGRGRAMDSRTRGNASGSGPGRSSAGGTGRVARTARPTRLSPGRARRRRGGGRAAAGCVALSSASPATCSLCLEFNVRRMRVAANA